MLEHDLLTEKAETRLGRQIRAGNEAAVHELVRHNLRLASFVAERFAERHPSVDRDDLCSEAVLALYAAARKFDPQRGRFSHYAGYYVREALRLTVNVARFGQRRPPPAEDRLAVSEAAWRWLERTGREPDVDQLACALGWKRSRVARIFAGPRLISLDAPVTQDGKTLRDAIEDESAIGADALAALNDSAAVVREAVAGLEPRAQTIIEHRFGLSANGSSRGTRRHPQRGKRTREKNPKALRAVGAVVGLTGERTRQIERVVLLTLRRQLKESLRAVTGAKERAALEARLLARFQQERVVVIDSYAEPALWFTAHRLTQQGVLRHGPCANTWLLAAARKISAS